MHDPEQLAKRVEDLFGLESGEIYSPGIDKRLIKPRSLFCCWAVRELGITSTAWVKKLGLSQPALSKAVLRGQQIVKELEIRII